MNREYTSEEIDALTRRTHVAVLTIIRHMHLSGPAGAVPGSHPEGEAADAIPVVVGVINAVMTFLMDDGEMDSELAIGIMDEWSKTVANGKAQMKWLQGPIAGNA
jgi:hypothetical protein